MHSSLSSSAAMGSPHAGTIPARSGSARTRSRHAHARRTGSHLSSDGRKYHQMLALKAQTHPDLRAKRRLQVGKRWPQHGFWTVGAVKVEEARRRNRMRTSAASRRPAVRPARRAARRSSARTPRRRAFLSNRAGGPKNLTFFKMSFTPRDAYLRVELALTKQEQVSEYPQHAHRPYTFTALGTSRCAPTNAQMRSRCTRTAFSTEVAVARQLSHATHRHTRRHSSLQRCLWSPAQARRHPARAETRPTSPAKDKPTAVRPSAGLEIDHLDPVG